VCGAPGTPGRAAGRTSRLPRIIRLSSYFALLLLPACFEKVSLGSLDETSTGSTGGATRGSTDPTPTGDPGDVTTTGATETTATTATTADTDTTGQGFIVSPDLGFVKMCDCPDDMLCVQSHGIDSWFFVCALPPAGCDPADPCSQACATACAMPPPLPEMCDGREPPLFLDCDDAAGFACSPWAENCPAGSKCVPHPDAPTIECEPIVERPAALGEPCVGPIDDTDLDTCAQGAGCWGFNPTTQQNVCVAHCTGTVAEPVCPPDTACLLDPDGYVAVCLPTCDPLLQDCGAGLACVPGVDAFVCVADLSGAGGQAQAGCADLDLCDPGLLCFDGTMVPDCVGSKTCCTPYCDLDDRSCSVPGTTCEPLFAEGQAPPGADNVGVCVLP
jgi:hypothetical protein